MDPIAERNHRDRGDRENHRQHGGGNVEGLVNVGRSQVFLEQELDPIGGGLQQPEWADSGRTPAVLHVPDHFALEPHRVSHRRKQHEQDDGDLDDRNNNEESDAHALADPSPANSCLRSTQVRRDSIPPFSISLDRTTDNRPDRDPSIHSVGTSTASGCLFSMTEFRTLEYRPKVPEVNKPLLAGKISSGFW